MKEFVCESDNLTSLQSFPSIDQAIIIREPFEGSWFTILAEANQPQWKWIFEGPQPKTQVLTICTVYCGIPKVVSLLWEMLIYIYLFVSSPTSTSISWHVNLYFWCVFHKSICSSLHSHSLSRKTISNSFSLHGTRLSHVLWSNPSLNFCSMINLFGLHELIRSLCI